MHPFFSIVIPVFKTEKYLAKCLQTVITQSFEDFEVIVVDDGSNGGAAEIVDSFHDDRIRYIRHEKNSSLLQARITGLKASTGQYVLAVDSDDYIEPNLLKEIHSILIADSKIDCVCYRAKTYIKDRFFQQQLVYDKQIYNSEEFFSEVMAKSLVFWQIWGKVVRRDVYLKAIEALGISDSLYLNIAEDQLQAISVLSLSRKIATTKYAGYCYVRHEESLTNGLLQFARWERFVKDQSCVYSLLERFFRDEALEINPILTKLIDQFQAVTCEYLLWQINEVSGDEWGQYVLYLYKYFKREYVWALIYTKFYNKIYSFPFEQSISQSAPNNCHCVKRIGLLCGVLSGGGAERATILLAKYLNSAQYNVYVLVDEECSSKENAEAFVKKYATVLVLPSRDKIIERWTALKKFVEQYQIDVLVHTDHWRKGLVTDVLASKETRAKIIIAEHSSYFFPLWGGLQHLMPLRKILYPIADVVTVLSPVNKIWWNVVGIHNAVYMPNFLTYAPKKINRVPGDAKKKFHFLFAGRLNKTKGVSEAITAFHLFSRKIPNGRLTILGSFFDDAYQAECKRLVAQYQLGDSVVFAGFVSNTEEYYRNATALLMCSQVEGAPMVLMEAKSYGVPAIIYEMPYVDATSLDNGVISVPYGDVDAMAVAMYKLCSNRDFYDQLSKSAHTSLAQYSADIILERWKKVFAALEKNDYKLLPASPDVALEDVLKITMVEIDKISQAHNDLQHSTLFNDLQRPTLFNDLQRPTLFNDLQHSISFRVGRAVTWPLRMGRNTFRCLRENGLSYTLKRIPVKFKNLYRRFWK